MIPVLVVAATPHGIVLSRPWGIALDGLLASVIWHRRKRAATESGHLLTYHPEHTPEDIELPLARCGEPDRDLHWHWLATFADLHPTARDIPDVRWRTSRTNRSRLQQLAPVIGARVVTDRRGRYQRRVIPVTARPATHVSWRAVGDPDQIRDLLTDLPSIGKHRGTGEGVVAQWDVTETPDVSWWSAGHEHEPGILGRTAPLRCLDEHPNLQLGPPGNAPIRPPYLHPATRTLVNHPAR
ncbi:hypothetical protein [Mycobacteroides abscessus]|uniref:hypothetical protein n=1 Tax=Mycobacteroides abscessus TaxID=36809 RepID=UPI0009287A82|nr:hypothetical protein [Mycobacteroides abscessus]QCO29017.1 hypothetical protein CFE69_24045 [Mycobacteroides abscessus subsp. massiliense]SHY29580.1 CRISPR type AFERR-associated protein Csf3 [Mycobacteroides abscessus subsp. abscessus]SID70755.1 CRISPR type AFERR-associated protein Csf3 [Mycobacteroides abscessus subsp. abscessus]SIK25427.1 CRISPR type AFERR-associated protein Csf3 [Mycobacteroides abscessus subsp. abscessus]SIM53871.1 CRISPR type AFERR-associated protein Csf3 [Mycobacteroi